MTIRRTRGLAVLALAALVAAAVALIVRNTPSVAGAPSAAAQRAPLARHVTVAITGYAFAPAHLTVRAGTTVTWVNHDATAHTATADHSGFDSGTIDPHHARTVDFAQPGTFTYHCVFHAFMTATITVTRR